MIRLAAVDFGDLLEVVWVSAVAGIGVTATFAVVVLGGARATEARRTGRRGVAWTVLALVAFAIVIVALIVAVRVMATK